MTRDDSIPFHRKQIEMWLHAKEPAGLLKLKARVGSKKVVNGGPAGPMLSGCSLSLLTCCLALSGQLLHSCLGRGVVQGDPSWTGRLNVGKENYTWTHRADKAPPVHWGERAQCRVFWCSVCLACFLELDRAAAATTPLRGRKTMWNLSPKSKCSPGTQLGISHLTEPRS